MFNTKILIPLIVSPFFALVSCEKHKKDLPNSEIYLNIPKNGFEVEVNDTIVISPKITYDYNSSYSWKLEENIISKERALQIIPKNLKRYDLTFNINNDRVNIDTIITVQSIYKTDFEELILKKDSFWTNSEKNTSLISGQLKFKINGNFGNEPWFGLTYSNLVGNNKNDEYEKYSAYSEPTDYDSKTFGVLLLDPNQQPVTISTADEKNRLFKSISINNSKYVYEAINKGQFGSKKFGGESGTEKDSLILVINGFNANSLKGQVKIKLADFTTGSNRNNTILKEWTTFSLKDIGHVSRLEFTLVSSDITSGKINTPPFVCIDELKIVE